MEIEIVPMKKEDIEEVLEIEKEAFSLPWDKEAFHEELKNEYSLYYIARYKKEIIGYIGLWFLSFDAYIVNIAVKKSYRRLGVGKSLIEKVSKEARKRELIGIGLDVRKSNEKAIALYESLGFSPRGIKKDYYKHEIEDSVFMWRLL